MPLDQLFLYFSSGVCLSGAGCTWVYILLGQLVGAGASAASAPAVGAAAAGAGSGWLFRLPAMFFFFSLSYSEQPHCWNEARWRFDNWTKSQNAEGYIGRYNIYQLTAQREQIVQDKEFNLNDRYLRILDLILYKRSYELKNKIIIVVNLNTYWQ